MLSGDSSLDQALGGDMMQTTASKVVSRNRAVLTSLGRPMYVAMVILVLISFECQK